MNSFKVWKVKFLFDIRDDNVALRNRDNCKGKTIVISQSESIKNIEKVIEHRLNKQTMLSMSDDNNYVEHIIRKTNLRILSVELIAEDDGIIKWK